MKTTKRRYSAEFKKEVVNYAITSSKSVADICREFDINASSYYNWRKELLGDDASARAVGEGASVVSKEALADQVRELRKQLARKERDIEILKKATLIFGEVPPRNMSR